MRRTKILRACWAFFLLVGIAPAGPIEIIATEGRGVLMRISGHRVLRVEGSPYEMGLQHGALLREDVRAVVGRVLLLAASAGQGEDSSFGGGIQQAWARCQPFIDPAYLEEMRGLADGAGLPLADVQQANNFPELFHCSGFALMGRATKGGRLLHGRILDYNTTAGFQDHAVTIVAVPDDGIPFMNVSFAGFLGSVTGMNERQIAIGEMGGRGEGQWDGVPMAFLVRAALQRARTLDQALAIFRDSKRTCEYYYVVSDAKAPDARGLYCTPDRFDLIRPGQRHELLPTPVDDAVLMSAGERYQQLVQRVRSGYGEFGPAEARKLMERPVAMDSNLHCVLFDAARVDAYVAVAGDPHTERYQACFQPYARINLHEVLAYRSPSAPRTRPATAAAVATMPAPPQGPLHLEGTVTASQTRPMKPTDDARLAVLLKHYEEPPGDLSWSMDRLYGLSNYDVYDLRFPSPVVTAVPENNTVYCEYYRCRGDQKRPAVIVLHISDGKFRESRAICHYLATQGFDGLMLKMAYYGPRRPKDPQRVRTLTQDLDTLCEGIRQSVMDARRAARWLGAQPLIEPARISILGTSLGGFVASVASGVDGRFAHSVFILAGGDLAQVLSTESREVRSVREAIGASGLTPAELTKKLELIEPCTFAGRIDPSTVMMVNTRADPVVPPASAEALAKAIGEVRIEWYDGDHYALVWRLFEVLGRVSEQLNGRGPRAAK